MSATWPTLGRWDNKRHDKGGNYMTPLLSWRRALMATTQLDLRRGGHAFRVMP